jgi:DegV family protein with EDD domain
MGNMVNILTDSCADLSPELLAKYQIDIIRLQVFIDNHTYSDGLDLKTPELFRLVEKTHQLPKTSAPSIVDFIQFFDRPGESIYIGIGSKLSATVSNAILARDSLGNQAIHVIDSLNLSTGIGLLALIAAELRDAGCSAHEIETQVLALIPKLHTSFVVDTLDYIYMGGRCSAITHIAGSLLKIRPVIEVHPDGVLGVRDKVRGSRRKALDAMLAQFAAHLKELDHHRVFVTHTGCDADAEYLASSIRALTPVEDLCITTAGSTVSSHCGPDTIGILYLTL